MNPNDKSLLKHVEDWTLDEVDRELYLHYLLKQVNDHRCGLIELKFTDLDFAVRSIEHYNHLKAVLIDTSDLEGEALKEATLTNLDILTKYPYPSYRL